uniref:AP complex subunit beta n=1 Tax=Timema shepardi TaxID=629360 RepID=A0A7R9AMI3_TIMSH|nr:unnamed protein product [Timema shepardi]
MGTRCSKLQDLQQQLSEEKPQLPTSPLLQGFKLQHLDPMMDTMVYLIKLLIMDSEQSGSSRSLRPRAIRLTKTAIASTLEGWLQNEEDGDFSCESDNDEHFVIETTHLFGCPNILSLCKTIPMYFKATEARSGTSGKTNFQAFLAPSQITDLVFIIQIFFGQYHANIEHRPLLMKFYEVNGKTIERKSLPTRSASLKKIPQRGTSETGVDVVRRNTGWIEVVLTRFRPSLPRKLNGASNHKKRQERHLHNITLHCFPSNTTHELQPFDKVVFRAFEAYWVDEVIQCWNNCGERTITKQRFGIILFSVQNKAATPANVKSGFRGTGINRFNTNEIPDTSFAPSTLGLSRLKSTAMTDSKYFTTTKKGEIFELKSELNNDKKEKKREAVKKDCEDPNPLIRALAVRTMGCIRVDKITEYLCEPLRKCLKDEDPYVRKTAAVCVAKLYDINAQLVEDQGFLDQLKDLLSDSNPMVVANAVAALSEINEASTSGSPLIEMNAQTINKLLTALNECTEWGQVFILDSLANYTPKDDREAQSICERITPRLAHANAAVVLSAVKVLMKFMEILASDSDFVSTLTKKLAPPLVTLLSSEPEVQYVALRNINLIVQKRPDILKHEMKVFFVKYNDPIYVKLEKLDIMIRLASQSNIAQVLSELKEYATEVDVDFVRKAVRAIGRCAIKVEQSAERCVSTLLDLIQTKVNYVVQEAIVVIKDIFRKYPNKYESIISTLCENLDTLDEPEARASMIWIIGEYAERIDNADELLESFLEGFHDENTQVQLQLLTAIVKLFLKRPTDTQELVLSLATQDSDNPDLRDRGFIYWRLLSTDPAAAKEVVLAEKPLISEETDLLEPTLLDELICHISSLASVYHKPPNAFVEGRGAGVRKMLPARIGSQETVLDQCSNAIPGTGAVLEPPAVIPSQDSLIGDLLSMDIGAPSVLANPANMFNPTLPSVDLLGTGLDSLLGGDMTTGSGGDLPVISQSTTGLLGDIFGFSATPSSYTSPKICWLSADKGKGLDISGTFSRRNGQIQMDFTFTNKAMQPMVGFALQLNKNSFGLTPSGPLQVMTPLPPNMSHECSLPLATSGAIQRMEPLNNLQVAIKNNIDVFYFACVVPMNVYFTEEGQMDKRVFLATWKDIPAQNEVQFTLSNLQCNAVHLLFYPMSVAHSVKIFFLVTRERRSPDNTTSLVQQLFNIKILIFVIDAVVQKMQQNNVFTIAKRNVEGQDMLYQSLKLTNGIWVLNELKIQPGNPNITFLKSFNVFIKIFTRLFISLFNIAQKVVDEDDDDEDYDKDDDEDDYDYDDDDDDDDDDENYYM